MLAPVDWIREYVDLPASLTTQEIADRLTDLGLTVGAVHSDGVTGPLVLGRIMSAEAEPQKNGKTINWCTVDVGQADAQGIVCGAPNVAVGALVVVSLPGAVLPGGFEIAARKTYGHVSNGMICSAKELGLGDDHSGIIILDESTGQPGDSAYEVLGLGGETIEFEILPDRAYALSLRGIAREAALGFKTAFADPAKREVPAVDGKAWDVVVHDAVACPVFAARRVSGFDPTAATPGYMKKRLEQAGMRSISLAVDVTNYVMLELGNPIHAYDAATVHGAIHVRRATAGEKLTTLDGVERALDVEDLLITDDSGPIGLAGVMGGASTEISDTTTDVLIEAAHFDPVTMFRSGRRHKLSSEAGKRNERGVDPLLPGVAADRVVELLVEFGGATAEPGFTLVGTPAPRPTITTDPLLPQRITGTTVTPSQAIVYLEAVGCTVAENDNGLAVTPPSWRLDINEPYDLVEEVARQVGYNTIAGVLPRPLGGRGLTRAQQLRRRVGRAVAGAGFSEVVSFPFVGQQTFDDLGFAEDDSRRRAVVLANPLSSEQPLFTTTIVPGLLNAAVRNIGRGAAGVALFETASVAFPAKGGAPILGTDKRPSDDELAAVLAAIPRQPLFLGAVLAGEYERPGWWGEGRGAAWSDSLALVRHLGEELGVDLEVKAAERTPWHPGRTAEVVVAGRAIGYAGELHPAVCRTFGLPARTAVVELDLDALLAAVPDSPKAPTFSTMPLAKEDVALLVDESVTVASVANALREGAGDLLESLRLFDVYTGPSLGEGKKSLAFNLRFRAPDRTLTVDETNAARAAAVARAAELTGATQR